ncbi:sporulation inhibitor of replication protein SirA [Bacillus sp. B15-48]|uniref:sporulation inhibitor of replication protein SirA n=1 Tax=Bacillus sp. B15-48 TaxID=1548601 RepID=UPI00193F4821|nr:sporulation inhibitor of replication protein SirA [Bacillus sp. B15-48]MBM4763869.1 sporulation inhibitor of replication protein SirA [Bacillus sp. B15-48]
MRSYQLYLIKDDIAGHYFGRERLFFYLFKEYSKASGEMQAIISRQIKYITKPISVLRIHQMILQHLSKQKGFKSGQGEYSLYEKKSQSTAVLKIVNERTLLVESAGSLEAETIFFEVLRKIEPSFIAVDLQSNLCGWLKPIKERKFV